MILRNKLIVIIKEQTKLIRQIKTLNNGKMLVLSIRIVQWVLKIFKGIILIKNNLHPEKQYPNSLKDLQCIENSINSKLKLKYKTEIKIYNKTLISPNLSLSKVIVQNLKNHKFILKNKKVWKNLKTKA